MYIQSFHMDGFGIFSDVSVENLSPGLSIFLGENEAGKSTCLEFLRTMLIGYPDPRNKEYKRIPGPLRGGQPGGSSACFQPGAGARNCAGPCGGVGVWACCCPACSAGGLTPCASQGAGGGPASSAHAPGRAGAGSGQRRSTCASAPCAAAARTSATRPHGAALPVRRKLVCTRVLYTA